MTGDITIYEQLPTFGGSLDGARLSDGSCSLRGGRMLTTDHYECTWDLLSTIPSLDLATKPSATRQLHSTSSIERSPKRDSLIVTASRSMGRRCALSRRAGSSGNAFEEDIGNSRITDWLSPAFFEKNFWYMWQTTFAFQPWHSAIELKRYLHRFMNEFPRIETLGGGGSSISRHQALYPADHTPRQIDQRSDSYAGKGLHLIRACPSWSRPKPGDRSDPTVRRPNRRPPPRALHRLMRTFARGPKLRSIVSGNCQRYRTAT